MEITFDPVKRAKTLRQRGLDFQDADEVFGGDELTRRDIRFDYGEPRFVTAGYLAGRIVVWFGLHEARLFISFR